MSSLRVMVGLGLALLCAGCPSVEPAGDAGMDARRDPPLDAPPVLPDVPVDAPRMCVASCTTDSECATSCPANPLGANCCDVPMGRCYPATTAICVPRGDAGPACEEMPCTSDGDCGGCPPLADVPTCCNPSTGRCTYRAPYLPYCPGTAIDGGVCDVETCTTDADCASCSTAGSPVDFAGCCDPSSRSCVLVAGGSCPVRDAGP